MKRTFAILLVFCMLLPLCGCAAANPGSTTMSEEPPVTTTHAEPTLMDEMKRLAAEATRMLESGQEYTFPTTWFVDMYCAEGEWIDNVILRQDGFLTIRTDVETAVADMNLDADAIRRVKEGVRYDIFLMLLYEEYKDCIAEYDYGYFEHNLNRNYIPYLVLFREYEKKGYVNAEDWWLNGGLERYEMSGEVYLVDFFSRHIVRWPLVDFGASELASEVFEALE